MCFLPVNIWSAGRNGTPLMEAANSHSKTESSKSEGASEGAPESNNPTLRRNALVEGDVRKNAALSLSLSFPPFSRISPQGREGGENMQGRERGRRVRVSH